MARRVALWVGCACALLAAACGDGGDPPGTPQPGVVFTAPASDQLDVPLGTRVVVAFSDPVEASALGACTASGAGASGGLCLVGPSGVVAATADVAGSDGRAVEILTAALDPGTTYDVYVAAALAPTATNLPATGPLFSFTTRSSRPRAAPPSVVAIDGADPAHVGAKRPLIESSTIHLVFSEPLAPATVVAEPGAIELVDQAGGVAVPVAVYTDGIHVAIDPISDLTAGASYELKLGAGLTDLGGTPLAPITFALTPANSVGAGVTKQVLRTRQTGDPGPATSRSGATPNAIVIDKPLIGRETTTLLASTLAAELGDPKALGGPIPFTIRRGARLAATGLDIKLGGTIPTGLSTGNVQIELLTDGGGRLFRNPHQPADQSPDNDRAPLYVDLVLDLAVYAVDPTGNAVLSQTVLGVEATGTVTASDGVLTIETVGSMELGLLGVTVAPTNLVLQLITDTAAQPASDTTPPTLLVAPGADDFAPAVDDGLDLVFSEPVDLTRLRAGGLTLQDAGGALVPVTIESQGAAVVVRPRARLAYSTEYDLVLADVADVAGNRLASTTVIFDTPTLGGTNVPVTVLAAHPGVPCALTGGTDTTPGRCAGGNGNDDTYHPFTLPANEAASVEFSQPVRPSSLTFAATCNTGSVRVEEVDASGACIAAVPGTFLPRDRSVSFVPDAPWTVGSHYRLTVISGGNKSCDANEACGISGNAASFDPLSGAADDGASGGPDLVMSFDAAPASRSTFMIATANPASDVNGSGFLDGGEAKRDANRAALNITDTGGVVGSASFNGDDCLPDIDGTQACMYLSGAMPVEMGELTTACPLPDGTSATACIPVTMFPEAMYATSVSMKASVGISISTDTGDSVMRIREPADGPVMGYIVDGGSGTPELVATLDLYMDAPDMSITLSSHDLHSKALTVALRGPVTFLPNGRIAIALANTADVPVTVNIRALGLSGSVSMALPLGEMKLQLLSPPVRGSQP